ncbi:MAG: PadR family transcriptional regulator [Candidatus Dormibacteria bacterium]
MFRHGSMRLYVLSLLRDGERHGYEIIRTLREQIGGDYNPSAGTVYPRLRQLEREGLVRAREEAGRVFYQLTGDGQRALEQQAGEIEEVEAEVGRMASDAAARLRAEVHRSSRQLRAELQAQSEALRSRDLTAPFASELNGQLSRFTRGWSRLVPAGTARPAARAALSSAIDAALAKLREQFGESEDYPVD